MTASLMAIIYLVIVGTSFLSGLFGMAGGLVLIGVLLFIMPLPAAMMLHAGTQMASNGWRAVMWRQHVQWRTATAYIAGCVVALGLWSVMSFVPSKPVALLCLGLIPFAVRLVPARFAPDTESRRQGVIYGFMCMSMMLLTGVAGPMLDSYFLGGRMDRRAIVATKGMCQIAGHGMKLLYFGGVAGDLSVLDPVFVAMAIACTMIGTSLAKRFLEAMSEVQFRSWARSLITGISIYYVAYGSYLWASTA
jgi:uncharacterized membrane protein YfcA